MISRTENLRLSFNRYGICLTLIALACSDAASVSRRAIIGDAGAGEKFFVNGIKSVLNGIIEMRRGILNNGDYRQGNEAVVGEMSDYFEYRAKMKPELTNPHGTIDTDPVATRFRRDDKRATTRNDSANDYMSTYYTQREAIMEKYRAQQEVIMERLRRTKSSIAETRRLKFFKKIDSGEIGATQDVPPDSVRSNITHHRDRNSTIPPIVTGRTVDYNETEINVTSAPTEVQILNSEISNDTRATNNGNESLYWLNSTGSDRSTEVHSPETTSSPGYEALRPFADDNIGVTERPDIQTLGIDWASESIDSIQKNEIDYNSTDPSLIGSHLGNIYRKNNSAIDQLEEMFLWDVSAEDQRITRSNETGTVARRADDDSATRDVNTISDGDRSENSSQSSDSLRFVVEIKSSPDVHVTKNIKNVQTSTTTYRNSTHEIVEIDGVVNSTKRIHDVSSDVDSHSRKVISTNPEAAPIITEISGGAKESEWCEACPHDYKWGDCDGTLFYQHNIFLRNRGPSSIDAIFGMNVGGPVRITCLEAIRFNQTRGIVTLHSGGPGHDFAKLRIRGFEGEGFSYIMKVWGVAGDEQYIDGSSYD